MSERKPVEIHPTACVEPGAVLGEGVRIGPYCVVGSLVELGAGTVLEAHVVIGGHSRLGRDNHVFPFAALGMAPQDVKYRGEPTRLEIGDGNIIREYVTMSCGTVQGRSLTRVGHHGMFMAHTHVAHDCVVGDHVVLANSAALAGHVVLEDHTILGGMAGIHQFARVGRRALVAAGAMVSQDVPPFTCVQGDRARLVGLNLVGLKRASLPDSVLQTLKQAYRLLFRSGLTRAAALARISAELEPCDELNQLLEFIASSKRGVCRQA